MIKSSAHREFFVWVDPDSFWVQNNLGLVGSFIGGKILIPVDGPEGLLFVPNQNPQARERALTPFHLGITQNYRAEYNLEVIRFREFEELPSRFNAIFLLESREDAQRYRDAEPEHIGNRILKRGVTIGEYCYSIHDSAWIKFLRLPHSLDEATMNECGRAYWRGTSVCQVELQSMGKRWTAPPANEVLFYGRIEFPNKVLTAD